MCVFLAKRPRVLVVAVGRQCARVLGLVREQQLARGAVPVLVNGDGLDVGEDRPHT